MMTPRQGRRWSLASGIVAILLLLAVAAFSPH